MQGDYFSHSVTLMIEHNSDGAFGLVINKPLTIDLAELLSDQAVDCPPGITLLESGPVEQNRLFFLHSADVSFNTSIPINNELTLSTDLSVLESFAGGLGPRFLLAGLGYAGWAGGQLENEIRADVWLVTPYVSDIAFTVPFEQRPQAAAKAIGIDLNLISPTPGHG